MTDLVGQRLDRYQILGLLDAGGMGSVYRARDTELKRDVAIKVLPDVAAEHPNRLERFNREIRTVAKLSHPNIVEIYDFGHVNEVSYAVMELLRGKNLRNHMRGRPMDVDQALDIGVAVASGLGSAHSHGILHRDIKPENIFVTSAGEVKVLDFGLARTIGPAEPEAETVSEPDSLTTPGTILGTTGYMSPEQVRAQPLDPRSDIFSLGCVLYEMLSGSNPFRRDTRADTLSAILEYEPPPLTSFRPTLPPALDFTVQRCLKKKPDERFESARDVAFSIQALSESTSTPHEFIKGSVSIPRKLLRWGAGSLVALLVVTAGVVSGKRLLPPPLPEHLRLAVMPFEADGDDPDLDLLAAGLTETVTEDIALLEWNESGIDWVVPRHALAEISDQTLAAAHRRFNNTITITGRLQRDSELVRLTLAAIEAAGNRRLRTSTIQGVPGNIHSLQGEPVLRIAEMIEAEVSPAIRERLARAATTMTVAFDAYLRGRGLLAAADVPSIEASVALLTDAVEQDPLFVAGHIALCRAYLARFETTNDPQWIEVGLQRALHTTELGVLSGEAWQIIGALHRAAGRPDDALAALERAVQLEPENAEAHLDKGLIHQALKDYDAAEREIEQAIFLRPAYWPGHDILAKLYLAQGMNQAAAIQFRHVTDCAPQNPLGYVKLGGVHMFLGRAEAARDLFERSLEIEPTYWALSNLGALYFEASRFADAVTAFESALEADASNFVVWGNLAYSYRNGAEPDKAEAAFRRAIELAEAARAEAPGDFWIPIHLAGYHAVLGDTARGLEILEPVAAAQPTDPQLISFIAETFEDLKERDRALQWVERAFAAGVPRSRFEGRPTLRDLVADERYRALVEETGDAR